MARVYLDQKKVQAKPVQKKRVYLDTKVATPKKRVYLDGKPEQKKQESGSFWNKVGNQLVKPVAMASNLLEDTGKTIGAGIASAISPNITFGDAKKKLGVDFIQHQADVLTGKNKRTYSTITNEIANKKSDPVLRGLMKTTGYAGDFILDPLNKVKIAELTAKGVKAEKTGKLALSVAEQANKGQRALLQVGKTNILPNVGNRVLAATTKANDVIRGTKAGAKAVDMLTNLSTSVRPSGVSREEFKTITDASRTFKKGTEYAKSQSIKLASELEKSLQKSKATPEMRSALLHAVEKGDESLVPKGLEEHFSKAIEAKNANEQAWKQAGGATIEGYGLPHLATDAVQESMPKQLGASGGKIFSPNSGQDLHRQWVKVDGEVTHLKNSGIKYDKQSGMFFKNVGKETDNGFVSKWEPVNVEQATAPEINRALAKQGRESVFKEDLPSSLAVGGISAGKKQYGNDFLTATKGVESEKGKELINKTYEKLTTNEAVGKMLKTYDKAIGLWKAQVLVAPSYHTRNIVGNLWNNFLAGTSLTSYWRAATIQKGILTGKMDDATKKLVTEMEQMGVIGGSQYGGKDITKTIAEEVGGASWNPFSQNFGAYKANMAIGSTFEDNAKIALYLTKKKEGYNPVEASKIVDKFLFDYSDLTFVEQNVLKRALPFYTWTSKNIPLQIEQFVKNPGKFSNVSMAQRDWEQGVTKPDERYLSNYIKESSPMRISTAPDGTTQYLLLGQWIPAAQAIQFLSQPQDEVLRSITPMLSIPSDLINNKSFFKDTLGGEQPIEKYPGELKSFLGLDMGAKAVNVLRGIRLLNEIDKLNPGEIFGGKEHASVFKGLLPNASEVRGSQYSPDSTQASRIQAFLLGKAQNYDPQNSKQFYDQDTEKRMSAYTQALNQAIRLKQPDIAKNIIKEMEQFQSEREGKSNKNIQKYNLIGEQYFTDMAQQKQAEFKRDETRTKMKEMIRKGLSENNNQVIKDALLLEPTYAKQALKDALTEKVNTQMNPEQQKLMYDIEKLKTQKRLKQYY